MNRRIKDPNFNLDTNDVNGDTAPVWMLTRKFKHLGNGHVYEIVDVCWIGDTDEWGLVHKRVDSVVTCVRSYHNFVGTRSNGERRYVEFV